MTTIKHSDPSTTSPFVTAIMPFYNTPIPYFEEALESVFQQEYTHWELLLVDDGSTDSAVSEFAKNFAANHHDKVRYLEHPNHENRGCRVSRQLGIEHANGSYIAFLDSDDIWLPNKLTDQVAIMEAHPDVTMMYGETEWWYSWAGSQAEEEDYIYPLGIREQQRIFEPGELLPLLLDNAVHVPCTCSLLIRKNKLENINGFIAPDIDNQIIQLGEDDDEKKYRKHVINTVYEDQVIYTQLTIEEPVLAVRHCWDRYRQHPRSAYQSALRADGGRKARTIYLDWVQTYLRSLNYQDTATWATIGRQRVFGSFLSREFDNPLLSYLTRRTKKWFFRLERMIVPDSIRHRYWLPFAAR